MPQHLTKFYLSMRPLKSSMLAFAKFRKPLKHRPNRSEEHEFSIILHSVSVGQTLNRGTRQAWLQRQASLSS